MPAHYLVIVIDQQFPDVRGAWKTIAPFGHSGKAAAVLVLGFTVPFVFNAVASSFFGRKRVAASVLRRFGDPLTRLFLSATLRAQPVLVTMENRKLYAGFVVLSLGLNPQTRHIRILPLLSGYRDQETGLAVFTTEYAHIYELMESGDDPHLERFTASDFQVVLPLGEIRSARLFDPLIYAEHFRPEE